jgi:cyclopropane fatty-acyl-phospholipid synthase-like methyltransferase
VFGTYRDEQANYSTCVFPRAAFSHPYEAEYVLLKPKDGMRLLDLGCGSGAAAKYLASRCNIEIVCGPTHLCKQTSAGGNLRNLVGVDR